MRTLHIRKYAALIVVILMVALMGAVGCGDPNREDCKEACSKLKTCDDPDNGGSGALSDQWLSSCHASCDEADEIDASTAQCIVNTDCENIAQDCGTGSAN
jgi:hypothetical protein